MTNTKTTTKMQQVHIEMRRTMGRMDALLQQLKASKQA